MKLLVKDLYSSASTQEAKSVLKGVMETCGDEFLNSNVCFGTKDNNIQRLVEQWEGEVSEDSLAEAGRNIGNLVKNRFKPNVPFYISTEFDCGIHVTKLSDSQSRVVWYVSRDSFRLDDEQSIFNTINQVKKESNL